LCAVIIQIILLKYKSSLNDIDMTYHSVSLLWCICNDTINIRRKRCACTFHYSRVGAVI